MNTLTGIEAERVVQILKHASDRLRILVYVPTYGDENLMENISNETTAEALARLWYSEDQLKALTEGSLSDVGGRDITVIKHAHRAIKAAGRQLLVDSVNAHCIKQYSPGHSGQFVKFIKYLDDLSSYMHARLTTTVEDEAANRTLLQELTERERHAEESKEALERKLAEVCEEKEHVTFGLDQTLRKLQLELQDLTTTNKAKLEDIQLEMSEAIKKSESDHEVRTRHLQDQVDGLERQLTEVMEKNRDEEARLRKEKVRAENELNRRIAAYDTDMMSKRTKLEGLTKLYKENLEEYRVLCEYFERVDLDTIKSKAEETVFELVSKREAFGMLYLHQTAKKIQALVRGAKVRSEVKQPKKGAKKGKKK